MDIPRELVEQFTQGDGVIFVGAGLSIGAGMSGWADLIRPLAQAVGAQWPANEADLTTDHLLSAAQHYENQHGRNALVRHLRDALDTTDIQPTSIHRLIASLAVHVVFTTNYDDLVERALREAGQRPNVIVNEPELAYWSEEHVQVVKLCGDLNRPESIVLTKRDFNTYFATHPRLAERLRTTLESKTALFLGYSLRDPFFNQIWDHIGLDFGRHQRIGYAVLFDAQPLEADDLRQRGIHVINLETQGRNRTEVLLEWLQALTGASRSSTDSLTQPPRESGVPLIAGDRLPERLRFTFKHVDQLVWLQAFRDIIHTAEEAPDFIAEGHWEDAQGKIHHVNHLEDFLHPFAAGEAQRGYTDLYNYPATNEAVRVDISAGQLVVTISDRTKAEHRRQIADRILQRIGSLSSVSWQMAEEDTTIASSWNTAAIRELLTAAFDDEELTTFCFDHFRPVYENFATGMSKGQKIQRLLDSCDRHGQLEELLRLVRERNPAQYKRFRERLKM